MNTLGSGSAESAIQALLRDAYAAVEGGDPARALRLVLSALQAIGGQAEAGPALNRVISQFTSNHQRDAVQELTDLFARAALASSPEGQPTSLPAGTSAGHPTFPAVASPSFTPAGWPATSQPPHPPHAAHVPLFGAQASTAAAAWGPPPPPDGGGDSDSMSTSWSGGGGTGGAGGRESRERSAAAGLGGEEATSAWVGPGLSGGGGGGGGALGPQQHAPILSETGREGFMECALADGSSYVCGRCGGVVLAARRQQHDAFWCQPGGGAAGGGGSGAGGEG